MVQTLAEYKKKRDFKKTPEPKAKKGKRSKEPIFVIQKHDATGLHYDFRVEADGVLKSWAVPKGPSTDPREKRLAVPTEDHPMEYAGFEGIIPEGEYGGGEVIIWDAGTFKNLKDDKSVSDQIKDGEVTIELKGKKVQGGYALIKTGGGRWLLIKMDDDKADARRNPTSTEPESVKSGKTIKDLKRESDER